MFHLFSGFVLWQSKDVLRYFSYLTAALVCSVMSASRFKPENAGVSLGMIFVILGMVELNFSETLALGCAPALVQCLLSTGMRTRPLRIVVNIATLATAIGATRFCYEALLPGALDSMTVRIGLATFVFFFANTFPVAIVIGLTEGKRLSVVWRQTFFWSFPYYLVSGLTSGVLASQGRLELEWGIVGFVVVFLVYRSYCSHLLGVERQRKNATEMESLHWRIIRSLSAALEARSRSTAQHLRRVQVYSVEIAKEIGLNGSDLQALSVAALLHDIGKLAVPDHIISKPGRLSPEEFNKIKVHPLVGAEILEQVQFPYPVVPIVRAHHEKWDGSGYPYGLRGEQIPMGARILAAVDCMDACATDREYRRALSLEQAVAIVVAESGRSFDPRVVELLERRYVELERMVAGRPDDQPRVSKDLVITAGKAPLAGFETCGTNEEAANGFLAPIAQARLEDQILFQLAKDLSSSIRLDETLPALGVRLSQVIAHHAIAVYIRVQGNLVAEYASGDGVRFLSALKVPVGEGLIGWTVQHEKPIVNGNPAVEHGFQEEGINRLRSAIAVPLRGAKDVVGALALYHTEKDAFTKEDLRILLAISLNLGMVIENALMYRQAEVSAATDYLTELPNARSILDTLETELVRAKRLKQGLGILLCDLDNFKQVNDRWGHLAGNKVLQLFASGLETDRREYERAGRLGGDEFLLVVPGLSRNDLAGKVARLSRIAEVAGEQVCGEKLLTVSVGEAFYPEDAQDTNPLLDAADRRMYAAKEQQRTRASLQNVSAQLLAEELGITQEATEVQR